MDFERHRVNCILTETRNERAAALEPLEPPTGRGYMEDHEGSTGGGGAANWQRGLATNAQEYRRP